MAAVWCLEYSDPSIIRADVTQFSLQEKSLTDIDVTYLREEAMWASEDMLDVRIVLQREVVVMNL